MAKQVIKYNPTQFDDHSLKKNLNDSIQFIQSLVWHPTHFADSEDGADSSRYADHLAVASNEKDVHVFDLSEILAKNEGQNATTVLSDETENKVTQQIPGIALSSKM